ncbi:hydrophobic protein [Streptomyces mirabilis]|uniref:hydrophobic protein n=1 Tax=Streptomyces mirabilis TaxID=68239 RepID=UPI0036885623
MFVSLLILLMALFGFGFLRPIWWVAAIVLTFGAAQYGRGGDDGGWDEHRR